MKNADKLIGKTISSVRLMKQPRGLDADDLNHLEITATDGSQIWVKAEVLGFYEDATVEIEILDEPPSSSLGLVEVKA